MFNSQQLPPLILELGKADELVKHQQLNRSLGQQLCAG